MRAPTFVLVAAAALLFAAAACSEDTVGGEPDAAVSAGDSAPGASGADFVDDMSCDRTPCEGFTVGAIGYDACCIPGANACGVRVGNTCVEQAAFSPPSRDAGGVGVGFDLGDPEPVVEDPTCPDLTMVMGMTANLPGCCDSTGVCGISTAPIGTTMGFEIPAMCVTAEDPLGQYLVSGDPPLPCDYPLDAGAASPDGG